METKQFQAPSRGLYFNTGNGSTLQPVDIGHPDYVALIDPDLAFWSLILKKDLGNTLTGGPLLGEYRRKSGTFAKEMQGLRFGLRPSAVYFNPTDRCNLNCTYCYIPEEMRRSGVHMSQKDLCGSLEILQEYFAGTLPKKVRPQIIFHGSEPLLNRESVFAGIERFGKYFRFGIQTNGVLLDDDAIHFLKSNNVSIGLSLDADTAALTNRTRKTWDGTGVQQHVVRALERLQGYTNYSVICTITKENVRRLEHIVEFFHKLEVPTCMLNPLRCTLEGARRIKPADSEISRYYLKALDRTHELYRRSKRKLIVANFANILLAILAPQARRLMCDISPCGGGRSFFAVSARGDLFPCSEFIGLEPFKGGNLFEDRIDDVLKTPAFLKVSGRKVEDIDPCSRCAIRHFCGSPCPAEAHEMNGGMDRTGAFCELYEEQVRYAFRLIADNKAEDYLWADWDKDTATSFELVV